MGTNKPDRRKADADIIGAALDACRRHVGYVILFSAALNILYLAPSIYMMQVYDRVLASGGILTLLYLSAVLLGALAVLAFLDAIRMGLLAAMAKRFDRLLAPRVLSAALDPEGKKAAGQVHVLREFDALRAAISGQPALALVDTPWTPLYIAVCFMIHPWIGWLALGGGIALVGIALVNQRAIRSAMRANDQASGAMYSMQMADAAHGESARALGMQGALIRRQLQAREKLSHATSKATSANAIYSSSTRFFRLMLQSASLGLGAYLAVDQQMSAGGIIAASILTARAYAPLELVVGAWRQFEQGSQAYQTLKAVLKSQNNQREHTTLPSPRGLLSVESVSVRSPAGDRLLLSGASFRVEPGEIVGVVGPSGAGKTTLMRAIAGASNPDQGAVRLDGAKLTDWSADLLGRFVGYLPQEVALFGGTISHNICRFEHLLGYDQEEIDRAVVAAAKIAGVHDLILNMPRGYDTEIGPNGKGISAGQAQRVALARALYRDPVFIVLDEPNAHLDAEGELALINALKAGRERGASAVVVAHRAGFMNIADKLLVVQDGRIEAFGPRDQIAAKFAPPPAGGQRPVVVSDGGRRP
jgi:ATP-binding cassette subfamily C protein